MAIFKKHGKWYIDYYYKGKRIRECVGTSKVLAKKALEARKGEIAQTRCGLDHKKDPVKFEDMCQEYLEYSLSCKRSYIRDTQHVMHLTAFFKDANLEEITSRLIERYKQERVKKGKACHRQSGAGLLEASFQYGGSLGTSEF